MLSITIFYYNNNNKNQHKKIIYLYDIFPDFIEFELFESYNKDNNIPKWIMMP